MTDKKKIVLVKVETGVNSNKQYTLELDGDVVHANWGRVGATGQSKDYHGGEKTFDRLVREKTRKGYAEVDVVDAEGVSAPGKDALRRATVAGLARPEFADDRRIADVIDAIVETNAHSIATTSGGQIKLDDGVLRTPLGVIGKGSLDKADALLVEMAGEVATLPDGADPSKDLVEELEAYLRLVPQKVPARGGWEKTLLVPDWLSQQNEFVQQLRDSLDFAETQLAAQGKSLDPQVAFRYSMGVVEPSDERFAQIKDAFERTSARYGRYRLTSLYDLSAGDEAYRTYCDLRERLGNENWYWHGTRASNVLSILAKGFYVPPANASFTTGRMFGDGVYLSKQSTKSANYAAGRAPGQRASALAVDKMFMFSVQAVMGRPFNPSSWYGNDWARIHRDYDSVDVAPDSAGVVNHEAVVWNTDQLNVRYLCEFSH